MKKLSIVFVSTLLLAGCGSSANQATKIAEKTVKNDETSLTLLAELKEKENNFLELMDDILEKAENDFNKASEIIPQASTLLEEISTVVEDKESKLALDEKTKGKADKLLKELNGKEAEMLDAFLSYKNNLTIYLQEKMEVNTAYETLLTTIKEDTAFREIELTLADLNKSIEEVDKAHETYETSAYDFSKKYEEVVAQ